MSGGYKTETMNSQASGNDLPTLARMNTTRVTRDFFENRKQWGSRRALIWLFFFLVRRFLNVHVYRVWVGQGSYDAWLSQLPKGLPEGYEGKVLTPEALIPYASPENDLTESFLKTVTRNGDRCFAIFHDQQVVSYTFSARQRATVTDKVDFLVPPGLRYGYKTWTHRQHRRRGLTHALGRLEHDEHYQRTHGEMLGKGCYYIEYSNYASLLSNVYSPPDQRSLYLGKVMWAIWFGRLILYNSRRAKWMGTVLAPAGAPAKVTYPPT